MDPYPGPAPGSGGRGPDVVSSLPPTDPSGLLLELELRPTATLARVSAPHPAPRAYAPHSADAQGGWRIDFGDGGAAGPLGQWWDVVGVYDLTRHRHAAADSAAGRRRVARWVRTSAGDCHAGMLLGGGGDGAGGRWRLLLRHAGSGALYLLALAPPADGGGGGGGAAMGPAGAVWAGGEGCRGPGGVPTAVRHPHPTPIPPLPPPLTPSFGTRISPLGRETRVS
jgi:hypothetical protein